MGPIMMYEPYGGGIWLFFHLLFWILIVIGIIWLIVWVVKQTGKHANGLAEETALDILKKRFAKGEISKEEYESMKKEIS
jgi:putative membrane protein